MIRQPPEATNGVSSAAYSVAVLSARQLNFMAYTNRAMVANQISMGQFTAFNSWKKKYEMGATRRSTGYLAFAAFDLVAPGAGSAMATFVQATMKLYDFVNQRIIGNIMSAVGRVATKHLPKLQGFYLFHNQLMRLATQIAQVEILPKIIDANAKNAKLANFGALAALLSSVEQQMNFLYFPTKKTDKTTRAKNAKRRFAAFVNDSRDDWTKDRDRTDLRTPTVTILPLPGGGVTASLGFEVLGGTALRFISKSKEELYDWTSLDTVGLGAEFGIKANFCALWVPYVASWVPLRIKFRCAWRINIDNSYPMNLPMGGAAHELHSGAMLGPFISKWGKPGDTIYGNTLNKTYPSAIEATAPFPGGYQPPTKIKNTLPRYGDVNAEFYPAVKETPIFLVSVRKNANDLHTSDRINKAGDVLTAGEFEVKTKLAGGDDSTEGDPGGRIAGEISNYIGDIVNKYKKELISATGGLGGGLVSAVTTQFQTQLNSMLNSMGSQFTRILVPDSRNQQDGAIFAIAAASVYFDNPDAADENGSTFTPYWQVRLRPVDDNIRKWSVLTQTLSSDTNTQGELPFSTPDPATSGVRTGSELLRLEKVVPK